VLGQATEMLPMLLDDTEKNAQFGGSRIYVPYFLLTPDSKRREPFAEFYVPYFLLTPDS
jgi:hypothetical protein